MIKRLGYLLCGLAIGLAAPSVDRSAGAATVEEYQVKAAFVLNFLRLTTWPEQVSFKDSRVGVCTIGTNRFNGALEDVLNKAADNTRYRFMGGMTLASLINCDAVFVFNDALDDYPDLFDRLRGRGILVLSDTSGFAKKGSMINLVTVGRRVRFEVNLDAVKEADLILDSSILKLGKIVE